MSKYMSADRIAQQLPATRGESTRRIFRQKAKAVASLLAHTRCQAVNRGGTMKRRTIACVGLSALLASLLLAPAVASADIFDAKAGSVPLSVGINSMWVIVAGVLVM